MDRLRSTSGLTENAIQELELARLEELIRSAGFFRQKSATLKRLSSIVSGNDSLRELLHRETNKARSEILQIKGIGPETADSILLYAGGHEVFVVDVYLRRWLAKQGFEVEAKLPYERLREFVEKQVRAAETHWLPILERVHSRSARHAPTPMSQMPRSLLADTFAEIHAVLVANGIANKTPGVWRRARRREQAAI